MDKFGIKMRLRNAHNNGEGSVDAIIEVEASLYALVYPLVSPPSETESQGTQFRWGR